MSESEISELLQKYDEGSTTLDEEERICSFMLLHPTHLRAPWFVGTRHLLEQKSTLTYLAFQAKRSGTVSWYKNKFFRIAASVVVVCAVGIMILLNKDPKTITVISAGVIQEITLPDGSVATLNKNATLRYPSSFGHSREVWLDDGEAFFDVEKDPDSPFIVYAGETATRVTGTSFNVRKSTYSTEVAVLSGQVVFEAAKVKSGSLTLTKGMMGEYNTSANELKERRDFDSNDLAWKTHRLEFKDEPLESVVETLERYFQIRVETEDSTLLGCRFRGIFEEAKLDEIIQVMDYSLNVKMSSYGSAYTLSGRGCNP